ncbi:hypothetical protein MRX96_009240 [Rhipicephalus microplus]
MATGHARRRGEVHVVLLLRRGALSFVETSRACSPEEADRYSRCMADEGSLRLRKRFRKYGYLCRNCSALEECARRRVCADDCASLEDAARWPAAGS